MTARRRTGSRSPASESNNRPQHVPTEAIDGVSRKIQDYHRQRLAIVYVRQSTPHQVNEHRESGELQYGLARIAERYGWSKDRILIIDEDQGHSGRTADGRLGFQIFDGSGNLLAVVDPLSARTSYSYSPAGQIVSVQKSGGGDQHLCSRFHESAGGQN